MNVKYSWDMPTAMQTRYRFMCWGMGASGRYVWGREGWREGDKGS